MPELKLCPFCGTEVSVAVTSRKDYFVYCPECNEGSAYYATKEEAVAAWNKWVKEG